jgi:hypothetical protein
MRVLGATFPTAEAADAARGELERSLSLPAGTFRRGTLGELGTSGQDHPLLAGRVEDRLVHGAQEILRRHGGRLVADVATDTDTRASREYHGGFGAAQGGGVSG